MKRFINCVWVFLLCFVIAESTYAQVHTKYAQPANNNGFLIYYWASDGGMIYPFAPFVFMDQFPGDAINMAVWDTVGSSEDAGAISNVRTLFTNGAARLTIGTSDTSKFEFTTELIYYDDNYAGFEARIKILDVDSSAVFIGFSSSASFGDDSLAMNIKTTGAFTQSSSNVAGFLLDADTTNNIWTAHAKAGTAGDLTVAVAAPSDSTTYTFRVELNPDGDVSYFVDGILIETELAAITSGTALLLYFGLLNRDSNHAVILDIDYAFAWQRE